jgi:hypothetical protein
LYSWPTEFNASIMMFRHEVPDDPVEMPTTGSFLGAALRPMLNAIIRIEAMQRSLKTLLFIESSLKC